MSKPVSKALRRKLWREWARRLESGKYKQARNVLRDGNSYCCLGVACTVYRDLVDTTATFEKRPWAYDYVYEFDGEEVSLPYHVAEAFGIDYSTVENKLATLNDEDELTFEEIAHYVRALIP